MSTCYLISKVSAVFLCEYLYCCFCFTNDEKYVFRAELDIHVNKRTKTAKTIVGELGEFGFQWGASVQMLVEANRSPDCLCLLQKQYNQIVNNYAAF